MLFDSGSTNVPLRTVWQGTCHVDDKSYRYKVHTTQPPPLLREQRSEPDLRYQMEPGPTEPRVRHEQILLSDTWYRADSQRNSVPLPDTSGMSGQSTENDGSDTSR